MHEVRPLTIADDDHHLGVLSAVRSGNTRLLSERPERTKALHFRSFEPGPDERFCRFDVTKDLAEGVASLCVPNEDGNQPSPLRKKIRAQLQTALSLIASDFRQ
jgi:hypothetical protein